MVRLPLAGALTPIVMAALWALGVLAAEVGLVVVEEEEVTMEGQEVGRRVQAVGPAMCHLMQLVPFLPAVLTAEMDIAR